MSTIEDLNPADAPEAGTCVRLERPEEGLAVVVLDPPHRPKLAVLDLPLMRDLEAALEELARDGSLRGVVFTGREPLSFAGGADIEALGKVQDPRLAYELARMGQRTFDAIAALRPRTVAAVGGPVPGGACELSLACDRIVLADHPKTRIGLPEVRLGILPGWGGSNRLPRRIGVPKALAAILGGTLYDPRRAKRMGMVDRLAHPEDLLRVACDVALGRAHAARRGRGKHAWLVDRNPIARKLIEDRAEKDVLEKTRGLYPAPLTALPLVVRAPSIKLSEGLEQEARALAHLALTSECKSLVGIFQLTEEAKRLGKLPDGTPAPAISRAGVIGGGIMGGGIASLCARRGVATRLSDLDQGALDRAVADHRRLVEKTSRKRRTPRHESAAQVDALVAGVGLGTFRNQQIVIEAVAERLDVKRAVLGDLAARLPQDAILATNTSSLSVDAIAESLPHPERVVGMHFFNPVDKMPLVEVVRGRATSDPVVHTVAKLALDLGKTPVITSDSPGFVVNRLLGPYLDEAVQFFVAGVDPRRLDDLMLDFGMPMGPLALLDEVGFDIAVHAAGSLSEAFGERMRTSSALAEMVAAGLLGKKGGAGFYRYGEDPPPGEPRPVNPAVRTFVDPTLAQRSSWPDGAILDQLLMPMVNEAARCLDEGVVAGPRELDLATVFGMGFAPFRGGLLRWADSLGSAQVVERLNRIAAAPETLARAEGGARFRPSEGLADLARRNGRFHG